MGAFHNPANTEVLPDVSCTNRPADSSYAHDSRPKSWCAANVTGAIATAPTAAQISPDEAVNARWERYQQSRAGGHKHAARMHQWRQRRAASAKIVTHHGSQDTPNDAVLPVNESPPAISPDSQAQPPCRPIASDSIALSATANTRISMPASLWRCHWCQSPCPALVRQGFLRHRRWVRNGCYP